MARRCWCTQPSFCNLRFSEVSRIEFLDGNSNQGDALCFEPVGTAPAGCEDD